MAELWNKPTNSGIELRKIIADLNSIFIYFLKKCFVTFLGEKTPTVPPSSRMATPISANRASLWMQHRASISYWAAGGITVLREETVNGRGSCLSILIASVLRSFSSQVSFSSAIIFSVSWGRNSLIKVEKSTVSGKNESVAGVKMFRQRYFPTIHFWYLLVCELKLVLRKADVVHSSAESDFARAAELHDLQHLQSWCNYLWWSVYLVDLLLQLYFPLI